MIRKIYNLTFGAIRKSFIKKTELFYSTLKLHNETFTQFKNICNGKKLVICGAGPTLQKYKPIEDGIHIALNRAFLYNKVHFDYIFSQDYLGIYKYENELVDYKNCIKLFGNQADKKRQIPESLAIKCNALRFNTDQGLYGETKYSKFVKDIDCLPLANMPNVGLSVLQFALWMNPSELYIVGCDIAGVHFTQKNMTFQEKEKEKQLQLKSWKKKNKKLLKRWYEFKEFAKVNYPDTKIYSVNPVGLKGIFEDIYQGDIDGE